ncbi:MAG TPA: protocatechuate 3,4-dioxygenase subunit beta [Polyangiaceae bacterium]|jgi:protocatechuate 3,4-dioxygenase beta subunit
MADYARRDFDAHPPFRYADYRSTRLRGPKEDLVSIVQTLSETTGPGPVWSELAEDDADLTTNAGTGGRAIGARTIMTGRVLHEDGSPAAGTVLEIWQANSAGRYLHPSDGYDAPIDPHFIGAGQCRTDARGVYRFTTVRPGPYPWRNHPNAWRPAHIHLSVLGPALATRLVTQVYFPDDPLQAIDPIFLSVPEHARSRLVARYDHDVTREMWALGYRFDIVLRGPRSTPGEAAP